MKKLALVTACLVLLLMFTTGAWADATGPQFTLSKGNVGLYQFWSTLSPAATHFTLSGTAAGCGNANCVSGQALFDDGHGGGALGEYWMWLTGGTPELMGGANGNYTVDMNGSTLFLQIGLGSVTNSFSLGGVFGTVDLATLTGGLTPTVKFDGFFTTVTSSPEFSSMFPVGARTSLDFTINLNGAPTFAPVGNGPTISGFVSSGELLPTPEPASLALLGTGVLGLAGAIRRKMR